MAWRNDSPAAPRAKEQRAVAPCRFFLKGACDKGAECPFSHGVDAGVAARANGPEAAGSTVVVLDGARVRFGPGLEVQDIVTDAEANTNRVVINGLIPAITDAFLSTMLER